MQIGGIIIAGAVGLLGCIYNAAVDKYSDYKIAQWTSEKVPLDIRSSSSSTFVTKSVNELRRTVSKRTGLVEKTDDRKSWNAWLTSPPLSSEEVDANIMKPGNYTFMYRSYVNWEEAGCIKKSLLHLKTWYGIILDSRGHMTVHQDGNHVSITETFRKRFFTIVVSRWNGVLVEDGGGKKILWTDTELIMDDGNTKIQNPPQSEALRKIPWNVVKGEDGMFAFRRGDFGMLVYDSKTVL